MLNHLNKESRDALNRLGPENKDAVLRGVCITPKTWGDPDKAVQFAVQWFSSRVTNIQIMKLEATGECNLVVVTAFSNYGIPVWCLHLALRMIMAAHSGLTLRIKQIISFESNDDAVAIFDKWAARLFPGKLVHMGHIAGWPKHAFDIATSAKAKGDILLCLGGAPCTDSSWAQPDPSRQQSGIHGPCGRFTWDWATGVYRAYEVYPRGVAYLDEFVCTSNIADEFEKDHMMGPSTSLNPYHHFGLQRRREVRMSPMPRQPMTMDFLMPQNHRPCNGEWIWKPMDISTQQPASIRAYWPQLVLEATRADFVPNGQKERGPLRAHQVVNMHTGETRYASIHHFGLWLGHLDSPPHNELTTRHACLKHIDSITGDTPQAAQGRVFGEVEACGHSRYCRACHEAFRLIGLTWHAPLFANAIRHWVEHVLLAHQHNDWSRHYTMPEITHVCGPHCRVRR